MVLWNWIKKKKKKSQTTNNLCSQEWLSFPYFAHAFILRFTNNFKKIQCSLLARYLCIYLLQKNRLTVEVELAQSFLAAQVKLEFSHPKEKPALCFLGQEGPWLGRALQGQARAFAAIFWETKDNWWGTALHNPQQELPPHTALSTGIAIGTAAAASSYSLSGWCHLYWMKIRLKDISSGKGNVSAKGQEFMRHGLWATETLPCNLPNNSFFFSPEVHRPFPCLLDKLKAMETEQTIIHWQNRTSSQKNKTISFAPPWVYATSPDFPDAESQKTGKFYLVTWNLSLLHVRAHISEKNFKFINFQQDSSTVPTIAVPREH